MVAIASGPGRGLYVDSRILLAGIILAVTMLGGTHENQNLLLRWLRGRGCARLCLKRPPPIRPALDQLPRPNRQPGWHTAAHRRLRTHLPHLRYVGRRHADLGA